MKLKNQSKENTKMKREITNISRLNSMKQENVGQ